MTETEIIKALHSTRIKVITAIKKVAEHNQNVKNKFKDDKLPCSTDFSLDETVEIYKALGCNTLQILFLKEHFIDRPKKDIYTIKGTEDFLSKYDDNPKIRCCNTCQYLQGLCKGSGHPIPYCKIYQKPLSSFGAKVYEDYCNSYLYFDFLKPRKWYKPDAPINLDMFGDKDTVNGINRNKFKAERSNPKIVTIVNQVGFD